MGARVTEGQVVAAIIRRLRKIPGLKVEKTHGGTYGKSGTPDLTGCYRGQRFDIEVKAPGANGPTRQQQRELDAWAAAGAIVGCAWSADDAVQILGPILKGD